ncbi:hypothetical protein CMI40_01635 [Candidatus Pacearchaeota archaeon]|jgi:myo-inositol-1(or 4)-monophosphatase|nr:hypothetical protein [Candidatus Pacearchaeota archaeon]
MSKYSIYKKFAIKTALAAGKILLDNYKQTQKLEWNQKQHFRTKVDIASDKLIRKRIKEKFPTHNIYSEENKNLENKSDFSWIIDPLDGTIPYTFGITDHFSVCVALVKGKTPIVGVIYAPKRNEIYVAEKGHGTYCNNKKIKVSQENNINHVLIGLDGGKETKYFKRTNLAQYVKKLYSPQGITCFLSSGCASVPLALTASGKIHSYMALSLEQWDMAAAVIINREAGAKVTNIKGKQWDIKDKSIIVANPKLHNKLLKIIS